MKYFIYILRCSDNTLYTGITTDLKRRTKEHNKGIGSKYTLIRRPVKRLYSETRPDRSSATIREREIKRWPKAKKLDLIKGKKL